MKNTTPQTRDLVFIGGGHAHALVLRKWGMSPMAGVRLTVINPGPTAPYTGMLPGFIAGHYGRDELEIDLVRLCRFAGARLILGAATGIDRQAKTVQVPDRPDIRYDIASIDVGITSDMPALAGFAEHGISAKPLGNYATRWEDFVASVGTPPTEPALAVIGAGVAGVELALAMHHRLAALGHTPKVTVLDRGAALSGIGGSARAVLFERLRRADIRIVENTSIDKVCANQICLSNGRTIASAFTVGAAGARPHDWLAKLGLDHVGGYLTVDPYLRSVSDPSVYAVGDCAHMAFAPRPKAGVYAVRQAPVLAANLRADLGYSAAQRYAPQRDFLKLISLGGKEALANLHGFGPSGPMMWRWKNHIDRKFMQRLADLPEMARPVAPPDAARGVREMMQAAPLCGGCGAKVGGTALHTALSSLPAPVRNDVTSATGDDAAILRTATGWQVMTTDHLRAFTLDPVLQTRLTAIHALGDIWAMGAAPQAATATIILPELSTELQAATLAEIMQTAADIFRAAGADIVGGHSSVGSELTIGFTITGLSDRAPITVRGAQAGDALILTKPVGSGTILAAEMLGKAQGSDVAHAFRVMAQSQQQASALLSAATAMTDVTGFGLAGHLANICSASGVGAEVELGNVPLMQGAAALSARGLRSSLYPANRASLLGLATTPDTPQGRLMFDPQTAGGLLASIPAEQADAVLATLIDAGYPAAKIGAITDGTAITFR